MPYKIPPYMNPLSLEDLNALNELAALTWGWEIKYWTEKELSHGCFILSAYNPNTITWISTQGFSIVEAINKFKKTIELV